MKVLVVDDEKLIREVIIEYLKLENYEYLEAETNKGKILIFKNGNFNL